MPIALCLVVRFTCLHLHKVPRGVPSCSLNTGCSQPDGRDVYGVIGCVPMIVVFGVGTQLPRRPVMRCCPKAGAGGGCYLYSSKFVGISRRVYLSQKSLRGVCAPNSLITSYFYQNPKWSMTTINLWEHLISPINPEVIILLTSKAEGPGFYSGFWP